MLTSEVIERKLPTLNSMRFSQSTCDALQGLVLRGCSTLQATEQESLNKIASQDSVFAPWLAGVPSGLPIAEALVRDPGWRDDESPASERLWQLVNVAMRLHALEQRFADELATQKREAIYHFAYGLSHELNNPLANIATRAGVLAHGEPTVDRRQMLETIIDNAMRGSEMLGDLMLLARPPKLNPQSVNLTKWFDAFVARCQVWAAKRNLKIDSKCNLRSSSASFDPVAMSEAAWCLVRNAFEASSVNDSVLIRVDETSELLRISICDSGPGLSAEALKSCFDPYFSGREAGRGLGLGLSKAQLIATMHGGTLKVCNRPGGGCESVLSLPGGFGQQYPS
jgi:signal transduction histidine kinase